MGIHVQRRTEVVDEADVIAFHDNTRRNQGAPANGLGIQSDTLEESHGPLLLGRRLCMLDDGPVGLGRFIFRV